MNREANEIIAFSITQVTEVGNSNHMEKIEFQKTLNEVRGKGIVVKQLVTDRHMQIRNYLEEDEPQIDHQFDVWHFSKKNKSKLIAAGKNPLVPLYKSGLKLLLTTFGGHVGQVKALSNCVFCFMFKINIVGQQVICSVKVSI